ncbi:uncharacterized protein RAG0_15856 [Rhynchosporium agropyri]|uniref:Uncharacterized protein n=1 Tax=Rhynchosporium agropyri TaxID=914238 RepID=A0A1E1LMU9_9HELO|nr:uncharacterized protein RAG0_15856 [Rhynchosporium agropyri]
MEDTKASRDASAYSTRLDKTLKTLQARVEEQEAILEELRASATTLETEPSADPKSHLQQLRALKAAYELLIPSQPWIPPRDSLVPGLLALRNSDKVATETVEAIAQNEIQLQDTRLQLEKEQGDLNGAKLMRAEMEARISTLEEQINQRTQQSPAQIAKEMIQAMEKRKTSYDVETGKLVKAFNAFIDDHLAAMLAVEELGGPIVGEVPDVDEEMVEGGFSTQGKPKKAKPSEDKRQRRIDQIWGPRPAHDDDSQEPWDEKRAAAAEMRDLTEELLNSLVDTEGNGPGAYVDLQRESAAARFLVRSKVAQFHPKDARKLRLIDFRGELDD